MPAGYFDVPEQFAALSEDLLLLADLGGAGQEMAVDDAPPPAASAASRDPPLVDPSLLKLSNSETALVEALGEVQWSQLTPVAPSPLQQQFDG